MRINYICHWPTFLLGGYLPWETHPRFSSMKVTAIFELTDVFLLFCFSKLSEVVFLRVIQAKRGKRLAVENDSELVNKQFSSHRYFSITEW